MFLVALMLKLILNQLGYLESRIYRTLKDRKMFESEFI